MQPSQYGSPYSSPPPGPGEPEPSSWSAFDPPAAGAPAAYPPAGTATATARPRARMGVVLPTAVLTALLIIAVADNQWVGKQMAKADGQARFYVGGWLTYNWRFTPDHWADRIYAGQFALIGTTLLLTALLVWCLLRGAVTWGRAFFGTWLAVLFATVVGGIVRGFVVPDDFARVSNMNRVTYALFGPYGPSAGPVFAGLVLGLAVALVTSLVAVVSRRPEQPVPVAPPGPPSFADYAPPPPRTPAGPPPWQDQHFGPPAGDQATTRLSGPPEGRPEGFAEERPQERPDERPDERPGERPGERLEPQPDQPTTALPAAGRSEDAPAGPPTAAWPAPGGPEDAPGSPEDAPAGQATTQLPPPAGQPTTQLPPTAAPPAGPPAGERPGEQATTRFPRPPDDEELGHIEP